MSPTAARSRIMKAIRGSGNRTTEERLASILRRERLSGWRRHLKLPGTPDFAWPKKCLVVFVDGCFWHGCPRCYRAPATNKSFWRQKLKSNKARDRRVAKELRRMGWRVMRVWECRIGDVRTIRRIRDGLHPLKGNK